MYWIAIEPFRDLISPPLLSFAASPATISSDKPKEEACCRCSSSTSSTSRTFLGIGVGIMIRFDWKRSRTIGLFQCMHLCSIFFGESYTCIGMYVCMYVCQVGTYLGKSPKVLISRGMWWFLIKSPYKLVPPCTPSRFRFGVVLCRDFPHGQIMWCCTRASG